LMNELSIIFNSMNIDTREVLEAAGTKWNFHKYSPGLVGGHCISVDPFYLLHKAKELGHEPQVIAAGRRVNDYMPHFVAKRLVKKLIEFEKNPRNCRVLVMGITFKENVSDIRNSKVVDLVNELKSYSIQVYIIDPYADFEEVKRTYGLEVLKEPENLLYDAVILAVGHDSYRSKSANELMAYMDGKPILFDLKGVISKVEHPRLVHWRL
jgi:UDP-N-acetyl-D-glucosamine/UDP-N-acetyl-D-galactosamine dehydrogenase